MPQQSTLQYQYAYFAQDYKQVMIVRMHLGFGICLDLHIEWLMHRQADIGQRSSFRSYS